MLASLVLAASMVGQFATPAPNLPPVYYIKPAPTAQDIADQAVMDFYCMSPNDGCAGFTKTRFPAAFRVVRPRLDAPAGIYLLFTAYPWPAY